MNSYIIWMIFRSYCVLFAAACGLVVSCQGFVAPQGPFGSKGARLRRVGTDVVSRQSDRKYKKEVIGILYGLKNNEDVVEVERVNWNIETSQHLTRAGSDNQRRLGHRSDSVSTFRLLLTTVAASFFLCFAIPSFPAQAGEVGAKITKAVTTSDLGISVRKSVVKGAQIMDKIDGQWERLSDNLGLGAERSKQPGRPAAKTVPELQPLNVPAAQRVLEISDQEFLKAYGAASPGILQEEVDRVASSAKASFERSGVVFLDGKQPLAFETGQQFNFVAYVHYKAYSNLLLKQQQSESSSKTFAAIRSDFEQFVGQALLEEWKVRDPASQSTSSSLTQALKQTNKLATTMQDMGLAAMVDTSPPIDSEDWQDFVDGDVPELNWNVAVDGDVTLNAQILLQEQGYRLYPNFARFVIKKIFQDVLAQHTAASTGNSAVGSVCCTKVSIMDYYFDTAYNSDPDKFEVKEVLIGVSLENE